MLEELLLTAVSDSDVNAWANAVQGAGGFVTGPQRRRVATLVRLHKISGVWPLIDRLWLFAAENPTQATIDLKARATATPVSAPTFTANQGYAGDGASSYINLNFIPSSAGGKMTLNSASLFGYNRTSRAAANMSMMGARDVANTSWLLLTPRASSGATVYRVNVASSTVLTSPQSQGFWHGNRDAVGAMELYYNGALADTFTALSSAALPDQSIYACAHDFTGGTPSFMSTDQIALVGCGASLNASQAASMYAAVQAYMTSIGANV